jgi:peptide/nickel transport system substrate-binding protein
MWRATATAVSILVLFGPVAGRSETPQRGGILRLAIGPDPSTRDCHASTSVLNITYLAPHYSTLLRYDAETYPNIVGDTAESWTAAADGLTYTFRLRPNITFHDGSGLSAEDVKATYERIRNPPAGILSVRKAELEDVTSIDVADPLTVRFRLSRANAGMMATFASPWNCIYSAAKLAENPNYPATTIMGSGPFIFERQVPGESWSGKRFDAYFKPGQPYLDGFVLLSMSQPAVPTALAGGKLDAQFGMLTPAERDNIVKARGRDVVIQTMSATGGNFASFNLRRKPFDDVRVRRALNVGIDRWNGINGLSRVSILSAVGGVLRPGFELGSSTAELEKLPGFGRDMTAARAEARRLLAEAGVPDLKFKILNSDRPIYNTMGIYLIDQWRQIGVTAELAQTDTAGFLTAASNGNFDVANDSNVQAGDEPTPFLAKYVTGSNTNFAGISDPLLDDLFARQKRTLDPAERRKLILAFEERLLDQAYVIPLFWSGRIIAHTADVHGYKVTPSHYLNQDLSTVWLSK